MKRAYGPVDTADCTRVLVDRLWPRGLKKADAQITLWAKRIAPSAALRNAFGHDPARWQDFRERYAREVRRRPNELNELRALARKGPVTLLFGARDQVHNSAVVLKDLILGRLV